MKKSKDNVWGSGNLQGTKISEHFYSMSSIVSSFHPCQCITYFKTTPPPKKDPLSLSSNY